MGIKGQKILLQISALLLAILLWVYVTNDENPIKERVLSVPLEQSGLADIYTVEGLPATVTLRCQATADKLSMVDGRNFEALVDLSAVKEGNQTVAVKTTAPNGIQIIQVTPSWVDVTVDTLVEREIPVVVTVTGAVGSGFTALDPVVHPTTVKAKGPKQIVDELKQIKASLSIAGATATVRKSIALNSGSDKVALEPTQVTATVTVNPMPHKEVAVNPNITGTVAEHYEIKGITVSPETVTLTGTNSVLENITTVQTQGLDVSNATQKITGTVNIMVPDGVVQAAPKTVTITVDVEPVGIVPSETPGGDNTLPEENQEDEILQP